MPSRFSIETLGCKLNQAESEAIGRQMCQAGFTPAPGAESTDIHIVNTCSVTHIADRKSRHLLRLAKRANPGALVVATGCYAESGAAELRSIPEVDLAVRNPDKVRIPELLRAMAGGPQAAAAAQSGGSQRTRSMVKVQDGCNRFCSFCIVPYLRGRERSIPAAAVVGEIEARVAQGYKEVVLTGTEVGAYADDSGVDIAGLMRLLLEKTQIERLRLSSLQPQEITPAVIDLFGDGRVCRHLHLPLQSGCDATLDRMKRCYSTAEYRNAVERVRLAFPDVAITTDVIAGFPGETEVEFSESLRFCGEMRFARIHGFPYSPRCGTAASAMPGQVDSRTRRERCSRLLKLSERCSGEFRAGFLGRSRPVLWEQQIERDVWSGLSDNYLRVTAYSQRPLGNLVVPAVLKEVSGGRVWGEVSWTTS